MGSEHYCLRWNNHQSNLLGVFSQLLQDESLVDVTLACSEGASIRAHKVVLSACSTYFQSLFLEHPTRHPIIILKDVRYPELRTLVDFMYKGEVNVQYCQLSALLKTAESLKVKGLAEMTNQNTALREPERDTERLRPHSATTTKSEPIDTTGNTSLPLKSSTSALSTITSPTRLDPERCSPSSPPPPPSSSSSTRLQTLSPTPLDLYQRKNNRDPESQLSDTTPPPLNDIHYTSKEERPSSPDDDAMSNDIGINMTINSNALHTSAPPSVVVPPIPTSLPSHPTDLRPSSRGGPNSTTPSLLNANNSSSSSRDPLLDSGSSRLTMPESLPGPSGMGPVQQVPLSLKKEIDWDRHEEKHIPSDSGISDFRHPHDTMEDPIITGYRNSLSGQLNRFPIPFAFPFAPLSLGLFDTDPSRILNLLHHQTLLAEEALRYRGVFLGPKERYNPLADMLSKDHDNLLKRNNFQSRDPFRYQMGLPDLLPATTKSRLALNDELISKNVHSENKDYYNSDELAKLRSDNGLSIFATSNSERTKISQKDLIDEILMKRGGSYLKDGIRFNPMSNVADQHKEKSNTISSSLSSASSTSSYKGFPETVLINEASVTISEDESKCNTCNAVFPSTWLLEQHIALQHSSPGSSNEEKSFLCDQYRNALAKHRESQNQRSRIPADKLFTCDVCGMQFRYLKSFKKHRLNHALERIHGKNGKGSSDSNELVSSSNEMMDDNIDLNGMIKDEEEDDDQNDMIDSMTKDDHMLQHPDESQTKISSSEFDEMHSAGGIHSTESIGSIKVRSPAFLQKSDVESSIPNTTTLSGLLRPDTTIGLSAQDTSLINFLRNDVDKQQNKSTPVSRFACPFCGKCVRSKENLKLHVRKHTGERPFVCLFCGRAFGGKSDLTRHLRIHTGERPYHCEACGKCFARADYLSKHLTTHLHNTSR